MPMPKIDLTAGTKRCPLCCETLPLERFGKSSQTWHGYAVYCKECAYMRHQAWSKMRPGYTAKKHREKRLLPENKERYLDYSVKRNYGLPAGSYAKMLAAQDGKCGICQRTDSGVNGKKRFHVDHCHDTGVIRGLLCHNCNVGIGNLRHSKELLQRAADYLDQFTQT